MKTKLLIKLRNQGRNMINITSVTKTNGTITGMRYGYDYDEYKGLFDIGNTEDDVENKACRIYLKTNIEAIRSNYSKYRKQAKKRKGLLFFSLESK